MKKTGLFKLPSYECERMRAMEIRFIDGKTIQPKSSPTFKIE